MDEHEVIFDRESDTYYQRRRVDNQTIELGMNCTDWVRENKETWWNIYITIYNKRKDMFSNMDKKIITGKNPFKTFVTARDMFYDVEAELLKNELEYGPSDKVVIFCTWVDNRRRDAYYKFLHKHGYDWGKCSDGKCIMRTFTIADINPEILENEDEEDDEE